MGGAAIRVGAALAQPRHQHVAGLHDVAVDRFSEFVSALQEQDLRHGAMLEVLAAVAGDEPDVSEYLLRNSDFDPEFATLRQARAIITTVRRQGLDSVKLAKLAAAMGVLPQQNRYPNPNGSVPSIGVKARHPF